MDHKDFKKNISLINKKCKIRYKDKFSVIVIDPPWNQGKTAKRQVRPNQTQVLDYKTMTKEEISLIPVKQWAEDDSFIFLWVTNSKDKKTKEPIIKMGFDLLDAWGFTYYTTITWDKKTGPCPFSPFQVSTEHVLFGYKGKVKFNKESLGKMKTCFTESSISHSVKPESFYQNISKYFEGRKIDIFARHKREGFEGWGDEYDNKKFSPKRNSKKSLSQNLELF